MKLNNALQARLFKTLYAFIEEHEGRVFIEVNVDLIQTDYDVKHKANQETNILIIDISKNCITDLTLEDNVIKTELCFDYKNTMVEIPTYAIMSMYSPDLPLQKQLLAFEGEVTYVSTDEGMQQFYPTKEVTLPIPNNILIFDPTKKGKKT